MRALLRGTALILHLLLGLALVGAASLDPRGRWNVRPIAPWWSRSLLRILGIRLDVQGRVQPGGVLHVANHVSWLDIFAIVACQDTRFVAKSEIRDWPIAGWLANALGTIYLRRGKGGARPASERLAPQLVAGHSVTIFPEGTTTDGRVVLPFHPRLFATAVDAGVPVQPLALRYGRSSDGRDLAPFIGDDDLVSHIRRLLGAQGLSVRVDYLPPLPPGASRDLLASRAEAAIRAVVAPSTPPVRVALRRPSAAPVPSARVSAEADRHWQPEGSLH